MAHAKAYLRLSIIFLGFFLLSGCAGRPLIEREIVRAIFFSHSGKEAQATLVLQDQKEEPSDAYRTAIGTGETAAQALSDAAGGLNGTAFYGVMDMVGLPQDTDYTELLQYAELIHQTAQPSPEVSIFLLDNSTAAQLSDAAGELYETIQQHETRYAISCGLENIASQSGVAALPLWQDTAYDFAILADEGTQYCQNAVSAQLVAILSRQTTRLDLTFGNGNYSGQANASWICRATPQEIQVTLQLNDAELSALDPSLSGDGADLQQILTSELETAFRQLTTDTQEIAADPFRFQFWGKCLLGPKAAHLPAVLSVNYLS